MSTEGTKPIVETPTAPAVESTSQAPTETAPITEPVVAETAPAAVTAEKLDAPEASTATAEEVKEEAKEEPKEEIKEEAKPVEPKYDGSLAYNAPSSFLKELLPFPPKKQYFWFGTEPTPTQDLNHYLAKGKEAAHSTAAWASQTGTGLLFFSKHGEKKEAPTGVLNLADAEDIKSSGTNEFSFKLHGHKHKFDAPETERDSWLAAVKKVADEAKAKKEEIVNSEGYKETLAKLKPAAAVIAPVSAAKAEATPKKSVETAEESPAEAAEESKKTNKSRSRSRGAPSIVGFFKKDKKAEEPKKAEEAKKEEEAAAAEPTLAAAPAVEDPVVESTTAPVLTDAVPPVESKEEEPKRDEIKAGRRKSRFESFFTTKGKPAERAPETKEPEIAPISDSPPTIETTEPTEPATTEPAAIEGALAEPTPVEHAAASTTETPAVEAEKEAEATTPTKERKPSLLAGVKSFTQKLRSPSSEHPPALESAPIAETSETAAAEPETAAEEAPVTNGESNAVTRPTEIKDKRRSSFFDTLKTKIPKTAEKKKVEPATEEPAATEAALVEPALTEPATETPVAEPEKTSAVTEPAVTEPKVEKETKAEKEYKPSPLVTIGRRVSKAIRGERPKREPKTAPKVSETSEEAPKLPEPETEPAVKEAVPAEQKPTSTGPTSIGDVVPEAVNVGTAFPASKTVSATA